uniref:Uncharacterized protein n=1 Tax=Oryza nivara TaxID=4536 RepID=A0A0E0I9C2_ORYNI
MQQPMVDWWLEQQPATPQPPSLTEGILNVNVIQVTSVRSAAYFNGQHRSSTLEWLTTMLNDFGKQEVNISIFAECNSGLSPIPDLLHSGLIKRMNCS